MANKRVFFAVESLSVAECGTTSFTLAHGVQSVGITTRFNLENVFELGQLESYDSVEAIPEIEATMEKVLDGYPLLYHLMTKNSLSASLAGRSNKRGTIGLAIFDDAQDSASGTPVARCMLSGCYTQNLTYTFPVQGQCTESVTAVGNDKTWGTSFSVTAMNNNDSPLAGTASGMTQQRQDVLFGACDTSVAQPAACVLPTDIPNISASGTNNLQSDGTYAAHIQSIRVATNLGREQLFELGKRGPYHRYVNFPIQVTTTIEYMNQSGDNIAADSSSDSNMGNQRIWLRTKEGTRIDLGSKNKLNSSTIGGANAAQNGGNSTITLEYLNFNKMDVYHPADPSGL